MLSGAGRKNNNGNKELHSEAAKSGINIKIENCKPL